MTLHRLLRRIAMLSLLPVLIGAALALYLSSRNMEVIEGRRLDAHTDVATARLQDAMLFARTVLAGTVPLAPGDADCSARLVSIQAEIADAVSSLSIVAPDGAVICSSAPGAGQRIAGADDIVWPAGAADTGALNVTGYQIDPATQRPALFVSRVIVLPDTGTDVLAVAAIRLDWLSAYIDAGRVFGDADLVVTAPDSSVIVSTYGPVDAGPPLSPGLRTANWPRAADSAQPTRMERASVAGSDFGVFALAPTFGPIAQFTGVAVSMVGFLLAAGLTATLLSYRWLRQSVLEPVERLRAAAPDLSQGRPVCIDVGPRATEDLRRVAREFTAMGETIAQRTASLEHACEVASLGYWTMERGSDHLRRGSGNPSLIGFPDQIVKFSEVRERLHPDDRRAYDVALARLHDSSEPTVFEFRAEGPDGQMRLYRVETSPGGPGLATSDGTVFGITQEVTDLRRKELRLEQSLALLRVAGQSARIGGWRYDVAGKTLDISAEMIGLWPGRIAANSEPEDIFEFVAAEDRERLRRSFWTCVGYGAAFDEIAHLSADGWVRMIGEPEYDDAGDLIAVQGAMQDVSELVRAQRQRIDLETLLSTVLNSLSDGFVVQDEAGTIRYMNPEAASILGLDDASMGQPLAPQLPPGIRQAIARMTESTDTQGASGVEEVQIEETDRFVEIKAYPSVMGTVLYFRDVTDQRDLRTRLKLLDAAIPHVSDGIVITDVAPMAPPGPPIVFVNKAFEQQTGYTREEALGQALDIMHGEKTERDRLERMRSDLLERGHARAELTCYRKDGSTYTVDIDVNTVTDEEGRPARLVAVHRDTTERRLAEQKVRAREEQFRLVSLASHDIIWDWDLVTGSVWHNDNFNELLLGDVGAIATIETALENIHPDDRLHFTRSLHEALDGEGTDWRCDYRIHDIKGDVRHVADRGFIVRNDDGSPRRMVGAMTDMTEMRQLDAQLHMAGKMQSIGQLTGGIAHDFNNLLTIVLGNCDMIFDITEDEDVRRMLGSILHAAERGAEMAGSLLAYARRQQLEARPTDINHLIMQSAPLLSSAVDATIDIDYDLCTSETIAEVDPDKLQSALLNLVLNAQAAMDDGGRITIATARIDVEPGHAGYACAPGTFVEIRVADTGVGMPPDVAEKAFEPFFTTRETGVGTGLGLSTVYGLVTQSGGHIDLETAPGAGTTIIMCLPVAEAEPVAWPETRNATMPRHASADVLVVEDDAGVRAFVRQALDRMGYTVTTAQNGAAALALFEEGQRFDVMCTDIVMPGEPDGRKLACLARQMQPDLGILLMTGYADRVLDEPGAPHQALLFKPFRSIDLAIKLQQVLAEASER